MSLNPTPLIYLSPAGIRWVKDAEQVIVVDEQTERVHFLRGMEAVVWIWLSLAYAYPKLLNLMAALLALPVGEVEPKLLSLLQHWQQAGLLTIQEQATYGQPGNSGRL